MQLTYIGETTPYEVQVNAIKNNVIEVLGVGLPMRETGFTLFDGEFTYDYSAYSTLYRTVGEGFQYSNDGEIWVEPTKSVTVQITWMDDDDILGLRPSSVKVTVTDGGSTVGTVTLKESNNWTKVYTDVPVSHDYEVSAPEVEQYNMSVVGTYITYAVEMPYEPTVEEQLEELTDMVIELDERVYVLEGGEEEI